VENSVLNKVKTVSPCFRSRKTAVDHFARRFDLKALRLVVHNEYTMMMSLLKSGIVKDENMMFPNKDDPFGNLSETIDCVSDIDTGESFRRGFGTIQKSHPNAIPVGVMLYMDKLVLDQAGHLALEPVYFTLTLFNHKTRNQLNAWRPLGYMPNLQLQSKAETKHALTGPEKCDSTMTYFLA
jgi:hypothetical protein